MTIVILSRDKAVIVSDVMMTDSADDGLEARHKENIG
jgi:hypothetical protein